MTTSTSTFSTEINIWFARKTRLKKINSNLEAFKVKTLLKFILKKFKSSPIIF